MNALDFVIAGLALWRVSALLSYETGPKWGLVRFRELFRIAHDDSGRPNAWPDTWAAGVLTCVWCLSLNLALPVVILWLLWPDMARVISLPFALSAIAILIEKVADG